MDTVFLGIRVAIAVLFFVAAISKVVNRRDFARSLRDFGLPHGLVLPLALAIPVFEGMVPVLLLLPQSLLLGEALALGLLVVFTVVIAINLVLGRRPKCHCFGQIASKRVDGGTLVRNGLLIVATSGLVMFDRSGLPTGLLIAIAENQPVSVALLFAGFLLLAESLFLYELFRQHGRLLLRMDSLERSIGDHTRNYQPEDDQDLLGLPEGTSIPSVMLRDTEGRAFTLEDIVDPSVSSLVVFVDPACGPCSAMMPVLIGQWHEQEQGRKVSLTIISRGSIEENDAYVRHVGGPVFLQSNWEVAQAFRVRVTPSAILLLSSGLIGSRIAVGSEAILELLRQTGRASETALADENIKGRHQSL